MRPKIFCLILNYKHFQDTEKCLKSLMAADAPANTEYVIVDNSPDLQSSQYLQPRFPKIKYIHNSSNLGFAGGNNVGIKHALKNGATHILIINPDVQVSRHFFKPLLADFKTNPHLGIVAPAIKHHQNSQLFYGLEGHLNWSNATARHTNLRQLPNKELRVGDFVTFACVLVKADVFRKCGLLDTRYFMYLEDVDYCLTAQKKGFLSALDPRVVVSHRTSSSFKKPTDKLKISFVSHLKFIFKWLPFPKNIYPLLYTLFFYPHLYLLWSVHYYRRLKPKT